MEQKIQLLHPAGKNAVKIDTGKYNILRKALISVLETKGELTHKELFKSVSDYLKVNKIDFEGSVEWYLESVKLDMEAKKEIRRVGDRPPLKYALV
jgi:hypothetical protein